MIEVKLSVDEYNQLYRKKYEDDCYYSLIFCKRKNNKIQLKISKNNDENIDCVLTEIDLNTPEGEVLSKCSGCVFTVYENDNSTSEYFIRALFLNQECFWCSKDGNCSKKDNINILKNVVFIDPIPYRTADNLYALKNFKHNIEDIIEEDVFKYNDSKIAAINETMKTLHSQLQSLVDEWDYNKEDSANGNGQTNTLFILHMRWIM